MFLLNHSLGFKFQTKENTLKPQELKLYKEIMHKKLPGPFQNLPLHQNYVS